jgi:hypothetical protein
LRWRLAPWAFSGADARKVIVDGLVERIGQLLGRLRPTERANFFHTAGYQLFSLKCSRLRFATGRLSLTFFSSTCFSRFISDGIKPPYLLDHRCTLEPICRPCGTPSSTVVLSSACLRMNPICCSLDLYVFIHGTLSERTPILAGNFPQNSAQLPEVGSGSETREVGSNWDKWREFFGDTNR